MGKVFQGLAVAAAFALVGVAVRIAIVVYAERSAQQAIEQFSEHQQQALVEQEARRKQDQLIADAALRERKTLASNQRCVAGTVITVNGTVYTQDIGVDGRPMHCSGNLATQPLR